jgi:uroporphyrin-III C-methyltransferase/precorrin-2 dehydrogenase/sirohydrochlorin ferrochelatase
MRLECGDPGVFARGAEEAAALDAAGSFLTERREIDVLALAAGQVRAGASAPGRAGHLRPGATLAL